MHQYWAKHKGKKRWGVRTPFPKASDAYVSDSGDIYVWADKLEIKDGSLLFWGEGEELNGAIGSGHWHAVYQAATDDSPEAIETK